MEVRNNTLLFAIYNYLQICVMFFKVMQTLIFEAPWFSNVHEILRQNDNLKALLNAKTIELKYQEMDINHDNQISVSEMVQFAQTL